MGKLGETFPASASASAAAVVVVAVELTGLAGVSMECM